MASKIGYLIGKTRILAVEEAVALVERLSKGAMVAPVTDDNGGYRYFSEIPGIRHMQFGRDGWRYPAALGFEPTALTATPVDGALLERFLMDSPDELHFRINILKTNRMLRGGCNAFWDADGSRLSIARGEVLSTSVSLDDASQRSHAKWRDLLDRAGLDPSKVSLTDSEDGNVAAEFGPAVPFELPFRENPTMNQVLVEMPVFSREAPEARKGKLTGLTLFGRTIQGDAKSRDLWQRMKQIWARWRESLSGKFEFWDISFNLPVDCWEPSRAWINANLPGPFIGRLGGGTATADVAGILRSESEAGQYVELCWKRVRGRVAIVAGIREADGWRIQLSGYDPLNEAKAAATREAFLKLAGCDDLFER